MPSPGYPAAQYMKRQTLKQEVQLHSREGWLQVTHAKPQLAGRNTEWLPIAHAKPRPNSSSIRNTQTLTGSRILLPKRGQLPPTPQPKLNPKQPKAQHKRLLAGQAAKVYTSKTNSENQHNPSLSPWASCWLAKQPDQMRQRVFNSPG